METYSQAASFKCKFPFLSPNYHKDMEALGTAHFLEIFTTKAGFFCLSLAPW